MCRSIQPLFNYDPPTSDEQIHAASLQYIRKVSGFRKPSAANQVAFERAVEEVAKATKELITSLVTNAPPRDRAKEIARAKQAARLRFGDSGGN